MKKEILYCDVCKSKEEVSEDVEIQCIFHTEQTEGRCTDPYLSDEKLDICNQCLTNILKDAGNYLHGWGAQGHNKYLFWDKESSPPKG